MDTFWLATVQKDVTARGKKVSVKWDAKCDGTDVQKWDLKMVRSVGVPISQEGDVKKELDVEKQKKTKQIESRKSGNKGEVYVVFAYSDGSADRFQDPTPSIYGVFESYGDAEKAAEAAAKETLSEYERECDTWTDYAAGEYIGNFSDFFLSVSSLS